jgi:hypothetical protein
MKSDDFGLALRWAGVFDTDCLFVRAFENWTVRF